MKTKIHNKTRVVNNMVKIQVQQQILLLCCREFVCMYIVTLQTNKHLKMYFSHTFCSSYFLPKNWFEKYLCAFFKNFLWRVMNLLCYVDLFLCVQKLAFIYTNIQSVECIYRSISWSWRDCCFILLVDKESCFTNQKPKGKSSYSFYLDQIKMR